MPILQVLYPVPRDVATFDRVYREEHVPLARRHLGMARFRAFGVSGAAVGPSPFHLIVHLEFESAEQLQAALGSEGGRATAAHAMEISTGGPPLFLVTERVAV